MSVLNNLFNINELDLVNIEKKTINLKIFNKLSKLTKLTLTNFLINDFFCTNLIDVTFQNCVINFGGISDEINSLTSLTFIDCNLSDMSFKHFHKLTKLGIINNKNIIAQIPIIKGLERLNISNSKISDLSNIQYLYSLKQLLMKNTNLYELNVIQNLTNLQILSIPDNNVSDISILKNMTHLSELDASNNKIVDINVIKNLKNLKILVLNDNYIEDISPLIAVSNMLDYYNISNNPIEDKYKDFELFKL